MSARGIRWPLVVLAILCLLPVAAGVALVLSGREGSQALGWALVGFFGSGVVVLAEAGLIRATGQRSPAQHELRPT